jgi:hypothetical protein
MEDSAGVEVGDTQLDAGRWLAGGVEAPRRRVVDGVGRDDRQLAGAVGREPVHAGALGDPAASSTSVTSTRAPSRATASPSATA